MRGGHTQADICQLGMDQRKVNMLAREYCDATKRKNKPIILSHRTRLPSFPRFTHGGIDRPQFG
jgi:hypothetical protein